MTHTHDKLYKTLTEAWKQLQENTVDISKVWVIRNNATGKWIGKDGKWCDANPSMNPLDYIKGYTRQGAVRIINKPISPTSDKYHDLTAMVLDSAIQKYLTANSSNSVVVEASEYSLTPGSLVIASGYARNYQNPDPSISAVPRFIGVVDDQAHGATQSLYPVKMLSLGGSLDMLGRQQINKSLPIEHVADINSLDLPPEDLKKAQALIAKYTGKSAINTEPDIPSGWLGT